MAESKHEEQSKFTITRRSNKDDEEQDSKLIITRRSESNNDYELERCPLCLLQVRLDDYHHHIQGCLENMNIEQPQQEQKIMNDADQIDFDALNRALMKEPIGIKTNTLNWDSIVFLNNEEREGSKQLQNELHKTHSIMRSKLPPFEMARFYIGSKCRIPKAVDKWMAAKAFYDKHNLQSVTEQQMMKCFQEMRRCMRFGGTDKQGRYIMAMKYSLWYPSNHEGTAVVMRCFLMILNKFTENLYCARHGMIFISDCANMGLVNFDLDLERIGTRLIQDAYPLRFGAFYMLNAPKLMEILIQICKPFMSQKIQERLITTTAKELFTVVARNQCPDIIEGGTYDDHKLDPMYQGCVRYMRRSNMDCFAS
eukprot:354037_1